MTSVRKPVIIRISSRTSLKFRVIRSGPPAANPRELRALRFPMAIYLDNAATSFPKPDVVCDAVDDWMRHGAAAAGRGSHQGSAHADRILSQCRSRMAQLLGRPGTATQVVFTANCTDSLNTVLLGFLRPGDRVIASTLDHNSVLRPLAALQHQRGISFELVDFDRQTGRLRIDEFSDRLSRGPTPRLVVLTHASNVTGVVQPVEDLIRIAQDTGAAVLLDAAQTAGHIPFADIRPDPDFIAAAGHKGLLGPLGTGVLWIRPGRELDVTPLRFGGTGTSSQSLEQPDEMPSRFESGNLNMPGLAGLNSAAEWILSRGVEKLHAGILSRIRRLLEGLQELPHVTLYTPLSSAELAGPVAFNIEGMDCRDAAMILDQSFDLRCRAGLHCAPLTHRTLATDQSGGTLRFSPGVFTTESEIEHAIDAVRQLSESV